MIDLILCAEMTKEEDYIDRAISSISMHKFHKKYILLDGAPKGKYKIQYKRYINYKKRLKRDYSDFIIIEFEDKLNYKQMLKLFIDQNYERVHYNLLIIQYNIKLESFDIAKVLQLIADYNEPFLKIVSFKDKIKRCKYWFNEIECNGDLIKTHGFTEKAYIITKDNLVSLLLDKDKDKNLIDIYYEDLNKSLGKPWEKITKEEELEYWKKWGTYEHKTITHQLLK